MPTAIEAFQNRLRERIKGDIGELMPDEVVKEMIARVLDDEFMKPRKISKGMDYLGRDEFENAPPLMLEFIRPQIEGIIVRCVQEYFAANPGALEAKIDELIGKQIAGFLQNALSRLLGNMFDEFKCKLVSELSQTRQY